MIIQMDDVSLEKFPYEGLVNHSSAVEFIGISMWESAG